MESIVNDLLEDAGQEVSSYTLFEKLKYLEDHNRLPKTTATFFHIMRKLGKPRFWVREKSGSSAEVDFVYPFEGSLYPIETKAGKTGTLRSLHEFMDVSHLSVAFRLFAGKDRTDTVNTRLGKAFTLYSLPYYLAGRTEAFIEGVPVAD